MSMDNKLENECICGWLCWVFWGEECVAGFIFKYFTVTEQVL